MLSINYMKHLVILLSVMLIACNDAPSTSLDNDNVAGNWSWLTTKGGIGGRINKNHTNTNVQFELILNDDYTYKIMENNIEVSSGKYQLKSQENGKTRSIDTLIIYNNNDKVQNVVIEGVIKRLNPQSLSIFDNNPKGITSHFELKNQ